MNILEVGGDVTNKWQFKYNRRLIYPHRHNKYNNINLDYQLFLNVNRNVTLS